MAELIETMRADPELTEARRRNLAASVRRLCAALGLSPEETPAAFWFFRERLERFHPEQAGITPHRWQTIRSDVAFALKRIGLAPDQPKPRVQLSEAWTQLQARTGEVGLRHWGLSRLAGFCDGQGIAPPAVDDTVMAAYEAYLTTQTLKTKPQRHRREVCLLWNKLGQAAPELGLQALTVPDHRKSYSPKWEALPPSFRAEAEAWLAALSQEADLLSETGPLRPLRPASIEAYRRALLQTVAGLVHSGRALETITSLSVLIEGDSPTMALQFHLSRNGERPSQMVAQIAHVLVLVAQHAVGADATTVAKLKRFRANLSPSRSGLKPKPRNALRQFTDRTNIEKLLILPHRIHMRLQKKSELTVADARLMQVALALELLLMRPIRRGNLVGLRLGQHVQRMGKRTAIVLEEEEVKNRVAHDYPLPPESTKLLDFYVTRLLPLFGPNPERFLFPGEIPGRPKSPEQFGRTFRKTIREETGLDIYPHLLRHFAATLYLTENPEGLEVVRRVLGHKSADTTHRSYAGVHDQIAVRRFDELVLGIRGAILKEVGHG
jgi:integrase